MGSRVLARASDPILKSKCVYPFSSRLNQRVTQFTHPPNLCRHPTWPPARSSSSPTASPPPDSPDFQKVVCLPMANLTVLKEAKRMVGEANDREVLGVAETADFLGIKDRTVRRWGKE